MSAYGPDSYYAQNLKMGRQGNDTGTGSAWDNPGGRQQLQGRPQMGGGFGMRSGMQQPQQKQGGVGIFGSMGRALGGIFGGGGMNSMQRAASPMMSKMFPQQPSMSGGMNRGIGPSMDMGGMKPLGMMKPPQMGGGTWNQMPGMNTGMKPQLESMAQQIQSEPGHGPQDYMGGIGYGTQWKNQQVMQNEPQGIGPSMDAMNQMLQQPEQSQQPAAAGPAPDFMSRFGGQPLNRGYGRM